MYIAEVQFNQLLSDADFYSKLQAFQRDSPLATDISTAILSLSDSGELQTIRDKYLTTRACRILGSEDEDLNHLQLRSFMGLFVVCGFVCIIALLIHFCKITRKFKRHTNQEPGTSLQSSLRSIQIQRFLSFVDKKEEESKHQLKRKRMQMHSRSRTGFSLSGRSRSGTHPELQSGGSTQFTGVKVL